MTIRGEHKYTVEAYDADEAVARAEEYFRGGMVADETECKCAEDTVCEGRA